MVDGLLQNRFGYHSRLLLISFGEIFSTLKNSGVGLKDCSGVGITHLEGGFGRCLE